MANKEMMVIESRLGKREIRRDKIIIFPRGIIGFEHLREFTILQIQEDSPILVLQSIENPSLGLLVADPFTFLAEYSLTVGEIDQGVLKADSSEDVAILVTASIPPGKPEETALNLLGPIVINHKERIGLQIPQVESSGPSRVLIYAQEAEVQEAPAQAASTPVEPPQKKPAQTKKPDKKGGKK